MLNVSRQIYRKLDELLPDLATIEPYTRTDLTEKGLPDINAVIFETGPERICFILSRYRKENGRTIAEPCFEIAVNPVLKIANVVTYKDEHYFHSVEIIPDEIGTMAQSRANKLLYHWLDGLNDRAQRIQVLH